MLVPVFAALGTFLGAVVWSVTGLGPDLRGVFAGLGLAIVGGAGVWFVAQREYERSGDVSYDAQNDRAVVTNQNSGHLYFVPTRAWAVILVIGGAAWALTSLAHTV